MSKLPKSIKIGAIEYEVIEVEHPEEGSKDAATGAYPQECIIRVKEDMHWQKKRHALWCSVLSLFDMQTFGSRDGRRDVSVVAYALERLLEDNPWLRGE